MNYVDRVSLCSKKSSFHNLGNPSVPLCVAVLQDAKSPSEKDEIRKSIAKLVRENIGAVAYLQPNQICFISKLPKTRSGKTARGSMAKMAENKEITISPTIEDPSVYLEIRTVLQSIGYADKVPEPKMP